MWCWNRRGEQVGAGKSRFAREFEKKVDSVGRTVGHCRGVVVVVIVVGVIITFFHKTLTTITPPTSTPTTTTPLFPDV
jgi:hypothetical protein